MQYNTLTDTELRRVVDNSPHCVPALQEAAQRFLLGSKEAAEREEEIERLESELSASEARESAAWVELSASEARESAAWARVAELKVDGA